jgi:Holliday junction DNA helicase RuvA
MIEYLKGELALKTPTYVVIETSGGVAYRVQISLNTYAKIEKLEKVTLLTQQIIKEDAHLLFGFADELERHLFQLLISVSGVGPSTAQIVLSGMNANEARTAIATENEAAFGRVKGIGPKTAKRIILDLKDKVLKESPDAAAGATIIPVSPVKQEAIAALIALGFIRVNVQKVVDKIVYEKPELSIQDLIKLALKNLAG